MKGLGDKYSFGFPLYAVGQCADILVFRPALVPSANAVAAETLGVMREAMKLRFAR